MHAISHQIAQLKLSTLISSDKLHKKVKILRHPFNIVTRSTTRVFLHKCKENFSGNSHFFDNNETPHILTNNVE